ncbi:aminotransferase DegT [bacterium K02(2017)]|nr:aminotransferase DegT [bacterium K02(2017)]
MTNLSEQIINTIKEVKSDQFTLNQPCLQGNESKYVQECLNTGWVSSAGSFVDKFESMLAEYTGSQYAIAVGNGTAALHTSLILADVKADDEVLIPALTFVATANAVSYCGANPHFVDCDENSLGVNAKKLSAYLEEISELKSDGLYNKNTGRKISALIPVHVFGHPADLDPLLEICNKYKIKMVEDATESLGSFYKEKHTGLFGQLSALSFNGNKILTTGGGGAILTNDKDLANKAKHLTTTAKKDHTWDYFHDAIGYNYRLPNINAALGCAQLEILPKILIEKRKLAHQYQEAFDKIDGLSLLVEPNYGKSNYWLNGIVLDKDQQQHRDEILNMTNKGHIQTRPIWTLLNKLPMYVDCEKMDLKISEGFEKRVINIPSSVNI